MSEQTQVQPEGQAPPAKKVEFSPEQQARLDQIIKESHSRIARDAHAAAAKAQEDASAARAEAEVLKEELAVLKGERTGLETSAKTARAETLKLKKENAIVEAANKHGFFDVKQVSKLVGDQIVFDAEKNQFHVIGEDGSPRLGLDGSTMLRLDSFFAEFASANQHLVRGSVLPGVGSRENQIPHPTVGEKEKLAKLFGRGSDSRAANTLAINNPQEYRRLKREARSHGLIS